MRIKPLLIASAAVALALPALAQQARRTSAGDAAPASGERSAATAQPHQPRRRDRVERGAGRKRGRGSRQPQPAAAAAAGRISRMGAARSVDRRQPRSRASRARRRPWGGASGAFLSTLMRRMDTPLASRWAHIALRDALLAKARAPRDVNPVDWVAERAWLLLRMGEADAARMLVAGVDTDRFTPKMVQVAVQSALANADPPALCPLEDGIRKYDPSDPRAGAGDVLVAGGRAGNGRRPRSTTRGATAGSAGSTWRSPRKWSAPARNRPRGDDRVGAGRQPDRLALRPRDRDRHDPARPADQCRLAAAPRVPGAGAAADRRSSGSISALVAAGLGVFSSQSLVDLYSAIYDSTDPERPAEHRRLAAAPGVRRQGRRDATRSDPPAAGDRQGRPQKEAARALVARAATLIDAGRQARQGCARPHLGDARRRATTRRRRAGSRRSASMDEANADRCWAMLALGAPDVADVGSGRLDGFIRRDNSPDQSQRALVAGLAGLGRINADAANSLNRRYGLGLGRQSSWTRMIDAAAGARAGGDGAGADRNRVSDPAIGPAARRSSVSCDRRR